MIYNDFLSISQRNATEGEISTQNVVRKLFFKNQIWRFIH